MATADERYEHQLEARWGWRTERAVARAMAVVLGRIGAWVHARVTSNRRFRGSVGSVILTVMSFVG
jgi:hypothetical protein